MPPPCLFLVPDDRPIDITTYGSDSTGTPELKTTDLPKSIEVQALNERGKEVVDLFAFVELTILYKGHGKQTWEQVSPDGGILSYYIDYSKSSASKAASSSAGGASAHYYFALTGKPHMLQRPGQYKLTVQSFDHTGHKSAPKELLIKVVPGEPNYLKATWITRPEGALDHSRALPAVRLVALDALKTPLAWTPGTIRSLKCEVTVPNSAITTFGTEQGAGEGQVLEGAQYLKAKEERDTDGNPELHVYVTLPPPSQPLSEECQIDLSFSAFDPELTSDDVISTSLNAGAPKQLRLVDEEGFKALLEPKPKPGVFQSVDPHRGLQRDLKVELLAQGQATDPPRRCVYKGAANADAANSPWAEILTPQRILLSKVRFAADGSCVFPADTVKLMGGRTADPSIKYGEDLKLLVVCTDGAGHRKLDDDGKELVLELPPFRLVQRCLRLDRFNQVEVDDNSEAQEVFFGDKVLIEVAAISKDFLETKEDWRKKGIRLNVVGDVQIAYSSPQHGTFTCGEARKTLVKGRMKLEVAVPAKAGENHLDAPYYLDVVLTGEMIAPETSGKHQTRIKLRCLPPRKAPSHLALVHPEPPSPAEPPISEEAPAEAAPLVVMDGDTFGFDVQVLDGNDDGVSKTTYGWSLRLALEDAEAGGAASPVGHVLSGSLRANVSRTGVATFEGIGIELSSRSTTDVEVPLQIVLHAIPPRGRVAAPANGQATVADKPLPIVLPLAVIVKPSRKCTELQLSLPAGLTPSQLPTLQLAAPPAAAAAAASEQAGNRTSKRSKRNRGANAAAAASSSSPIPAAAAAEPPAPQREYELVGHTASRVEGIVVRACSLAGDLDPSEVDLIFDGLPELLECDDEGEGLRLPALLLPEQASPGIRIAIVDRKSGVSVPLTVKVRPDTRDKKSLQWVLKGPPNASVDRCWHDHFEVSLVEKKGNHENAVSLEEAGLTEGDVLLRVREQQSGEFCNVAFGALVAETRKGLARSVTVTALSADMDPLAKKPQDSIEMRVDLVAGPPHSVRIMPEELRLRNCEPLPDVSIRLYDQWGNCSGGKITARISASELLTQDLATPFAVCSATGDDGTANFSLADRRLQLATETFGAPLGSLQRHFILKLSDPPNLPDAELSIVLTAGKHPVKISCSSTGIERCVAREITLGSLELSFIAEDASSVPKDEALGLVKRLSIKYREQLTLAAPWVAMPLDVKPADVDENGKVTVALGVWPGPSRPGSFALAVAVDAADAAESQLPPLPPVKECFVTLTLTAGKAHGLRMGEPSGVKMELPPSMEVGDALRYAGVQQAKQPDGTFVAERPVRIFCVDECGNPVAFPSKTSISAMVIADPTSGAAPAAAASSEAPSLPCFDPPLQGIDVSGRVSFQLPATRIVGGSSARVFARIYFDSSFSPGSRCSACAGTELCEGCDATIGVKHALMYHADRLDSETQKLQGEIDDLAQKQTKLKDELADVMRQLQAQQRSSSAARARVAGAESTIFRCQARINANRQQLTGCLSTLPHVNNRTDAGIPNGCAWDCIRRDGLTNAVYGVPAELGRVQAVDVANCIAKLIGARMLNIYATDEHTVDQVLIPAVKNRGCFYDIRAVMDPWVRRSRYNGDVSRDPQKLLAGAQWETPMKLDPVMRTPLPAHYGCLGYAVNLIHIEEQHAEEVRCSIFFPLLGQALLFEAIEGLLRFKHDHPNVPKTLMSLCGHMVKSDGARQGGGGGSGASIPRTGFCGVPQNVQALDPRFQRAQRLGGEVQDTETDLVAATRIKTDSEGELRRAEGQVGLLTTRKRELEDRINAADTNIQQKQRELESIKRKREQEQEQGLPAAKKARKK